MRNGGPMVGRLIDRLRGLEQPPGWDTELIVGYNPSRDGTLDVLRAKGVRIVPCGRLGPAANRNSAAREARGSLLYFIDHDCRPARSDFLVRLTEAAERLGEFGGLAGPILADPDQRWNPVAQGDHYACWFNWSQQRATGPTTLFNPSASLAMSRSVFEAVGGFDERIPYLHDFDIQEKARRRGWPLHFSRELPVIHHDRATLWASWRHSWEWGSVYRAEYIYPAQREAWWFVDRPALFWLNLPKMLQHRWRLVTRQAWAASRADTMYCYPFLLATVFVWALAVSLRHNPLAEPPVVRLD